MADQQPEPEKRYCRTCHKELRDWRKKYCSDSCVPEKPPKPPKRKPPPNPRPLESPSGTAAVANTQPPNGEPVKRKGPKLFRGKRSDELLAAIFDDMAQYGMSEAQACAGHNVRAETFSRWKNLPECEGMRERAQYISIKTLVAKFENAPPGEYKRFGWLLERIYRTQYGDPAKIGVQVNQQFNNGENGNLVSNQVEELAATRKRLDECKILEAKRKAGVATNTELREYFVEKIEAFQHLIDCLDAGETPDQETQQQLYRFHEEKRRQEQEPIRPVEGHVAASHHVGGQLALKAPDEEPAPEPERESRPQRPGPRATSMRAGEMDPLSGVAKPAEPPTPWSAKKPLAGPLSTRQRLAQERERKGAEGKTPW